MNNVLNVFYGVDFKKIRLYARFKPGKASEFLQYHEQFGSRYDVFGDKWFDVVSVDFYDQICKFYAYEKRIQANCLVTVSWDFVEFAYYFENTRPEELNVLGM